MAEHEWRCYVVMGGDSELGILEPVKAFADRVQAQEWAREELGAENYSIEDIPVAVPKNSLAVRNARDTTGRALWMGPEFLSDLLYRVLRGDRFISRFPDNRRLRFKFAGYEGDTDRLLFQVDTDALPDDVEEFRVEFTSAGEQAVIVDVPGTVSRGVD